MEHSGLSRLLAVAAASGAVMGLSWAVMAPYLRGLGFSGTAYGSLGGLAVVAGGVFTLAGGVLSDTVGARRTLAAGLALAGLALALVSTGRLPLVALGFALNGAANGLSWTAMQALTSRTGRDEELHYTFSYVGAARTLGGALGSFLGWAPVLAARTHGVPLSEAYSAALLAAGAASIAAAPLALAVPEPPSPRRRVAGLGGVLAAARGLGGDFYFIAAVEGLIGLGAAMSIHNIDYYFTAKYRVTSAGLGSVLGLQELAMAALMVYMPRLADRYGGALRVYLALTSASIPLLVAMTLTDDFAVAAALFLARSVLMNVANPLMTAFTMSLVPRERRGLASAFLSLSWTLPAAGGRALGGYLLDVDLELPLRLTALIYTAGLAALALHFRGRGAPAGAPRVPGAAGVVGPTSGAR